MSLEDLTGVSRYINSLVNTNPSSSDPKSEGDNHLTGIKNVILNTFAAITGAVIATHIELNKLAGFVGAIPALGTAQEWTARQNFDMQSLTPGSAVDWNLNTQQVAELVLDNATTTLNNPTNQVAGATYILIVKQDATGSRNITSYGSSYLFANGIEPILGDSANAINVLSFVSDGTYMLGTGLVSMA